MAKPKKSETVPVAMQATFDRITAITNDFAREHLNDEYATLIRQATAALCRKRPSPLLSGRDRTWACGITHAIGMVNFLFDTHRSPHISAKNLYAWFGVSGSTGQAKSKQVRDLLKMELMDPDWWLPSRMDENPLAWMISVNGMILDARSAPPDVQVQLAAAGLIPYAPAAQGAATGLATRETLPPAQGKAQAKSKRRVANDRSPDTLYVLEVNIFDGPMTPAFVRKNPMIIRTIEILGGQTLADLHMAIFRAFDREEEHLYEFQVEGKGPHDPNAQRYGPSATGAGTPLSDYEGEASQVTINSLGLVVGEMFGYWFDFGDDWWHGVEVMAIKAKAGKGKYPKITHRQGASPPQYPD